MSKPAKKKILLLYAHAGNGHRSAVQALETTISMHYADTYEVKVMDIFKVADIQPFNNTDAIHQLVSENYTVEAVNNGLMRLFNIPLFFSLFSQYVLFFMREECERIIALEQPDLVVTAHPLVAMVVSDIKARGARFKYATMITDLVTLFRGWGDWNADLVISPTTEAVNTLVKYGVKVERIVYPLFPVKPGLDNVCPKEEIFERHQLDPKKVTILVTGGGVATKSLMKGVDKILGDEKYQVLVVTGNAESLRQALESQYEFKTNVRILGFVKLEDYINAADVVVGKPGPATILEMELFNKKAVLTRRIGHQEEGNVAYALRNPLFRYISDNWGKLGDAIEDLMQANFREPKQGHRRSFNESLTIVEELIKLID